MILLVDNCGWMLNGLLLLLDVYLFDCDSLICDEIHIMHSIMLELVSYMGLCHDESKWFDVLEILDPTLGTKVSGKHNWSLVKTIFMWVTTWRLRDGHCDLKEQWQVNGYVIDGKSYNKTLEAKTRYGTCEAYVVWSVG